MDISFRTSPDETDEELEERSRTWLMMTLRVNAKIAGYKGDFDDLTTETRGDLRIIFHLGIPLIAFRNPVRGAPYRDVEGGPLHQDVKLPMFIGDALRDELELHDTLTVIRSKN